MIDEELGALVEDKDIPYSVQLQLIKKRTERGMSPLQIARLMGLKQASIQQIVDEHGWEPKRKVEEERKEARKTQAQLEREQLAGIMRGLAQRGMTRQEVADIIGKSRDYVKNVASQYNIRFKSAKRKARYKSVEFFEQLKVLEGRGMTKKQMAKELSVSEQSVRDCYNFFEKGVLP